ncbi:MAG: hypothetical protein AAF798_02135 [Bacteroidota bacterium]
MKRQHLLEHHPALAILRKAIRKEARQQRGVGLFFGLAGAVLLAFGFSNSVLLSVIGLAMLVWCIRLILTAPLEVDASPIMRKLHYQPEDVVWVYSLITQRMPFGFHFIDSGILYFKLSDGDELSVSVPSHQLKLISKTLNRVLPHAAFGYSEEREHRFRHNPNTLRKDLN